MGGTVSKTAKRRPWSVELVEAAEQAVVEVPHTYPSIARLAEVMASLESASEETWLAHHEEVEP